MNTNLLWLFRLGQIKTETVKLRVGLKQGCVLSPLLFALYISELGKKLESCGKGVKIGGIIIPALFFADDIVVLAESDEQMSELLNIIVGFGESRKLEFNAKKSKVLANWRKKIGEKEKEWVIGGKVVKEGVSHSLIIKECEDYKYLGITIQIRGRTLRGHEKERLEKTRKKGCLVSMFSRGGINKSYCARVGWERVIVPFSIYGCEALSLSKKWLEDMEKEQTKMGRFITGASKQCALEGIRGDIGWLYLVDKIAQAKCLYATRLETTEDEWLQEVFREAKRVNTPWWNQTREILLKYDIDVELLISRGGEFKKLCQEGYKHQERAGMAKRGKVKGNSTINEI